MVSASAAAAIDDESSDLFVSDVSLWEIALKHSAGRLPMPAAPRRWIPEKLKYHQLQRLPIEPAAIYRSGELPRSHSDPFDRLIAAHAMESRLILLSPDASLSLLGASRVW